MNKCIWIVNYYYPQPDNIRHARHLMFSKYLQEDGYDVFNFTACKYNEGEGKVLKKNFLYSVVTYGNYKYVHINTISSTNNVTRALSIFLFALILYICRHKFTKPHVVIHNIHEPFDYPICLCAKGMKSLYIVDDWDLWAYSFVRHGMIKKNGLLARFIFRIDRKFFENADRIVFSMEGGADYIRDNQWDVESGGSIDLKKVSYINNGVDVYATKNNENRYQLDDADLNDLNTFKAVYVGSVSRSNDLMIFIKAAKELESENDFRFLIYGDGNEREKLEKYCIENNVTNVLFKQKSVPLVYVPYVLSRCDLNIICHKQGFKYGLSLGKLFQAFASGKPICCNTTNEYDLIRKYNLGISGDFVDEHECALAIRQLKTMSQNEYNNMCSRVMKIAWQFDYKVLSDKLVKIVNELLG